MIERVSDQVDPLLSIRDLVVEFRTDEGVVRAVDGVSYDVFPGETLGVVGETGSGKSVTVLAALGLLPRHGVNRIDGSVWFGGRDLLRASQRDLQDVRGRDIAMVFQDPVSALNPVKRIGDQIAEALLLHDSKLSGRTARMRAVELLELVGVPQPAIRAHQYPHQFSGGMCQRAVIAMAMANRPSVLIADEPTTAVDVSIQDQLLDVLRAAQQETGAAMVMITHDLGVIAEVADHVCVMYSGRVVESGPVHDLFAKPAHPYTTGLIDCIPRIDGPLQRLRPIPGHPPNLVEKMDGCPFAPRCELRQGRDICVEVRPDLTDRTGAPGRSSACHFAAEVALPRAVSSAGVSAGAGAGARDGSSPAAAVRPLLEVEQLVKLFPIRKGVLSRARGAVRAVDGVSFSVQAGETLGLVGESGCGKSTTARMLLRLEEPTSGEVTFDGDKIDGRNRTQLKDVRRKIQMVFQDPYGSLNPRLSAGDNVTEPLRIAGGMSREQRRKRAFELFEQVGLRREYAERLPRQFSGGQRQRIAIARALAPRPRLLLLDEPVSALDVSVQAQVLNLLQDLKSELGLAYLFVSHDLSVVRHVSDNVAVMYLGRIVEYGSKDEIFGNPQHPYTKALLAAVPLPDPAGREARGFARLTGEIPSSSNPPSGCRFRTRCPLAVELCAVEEPTLTNRGSGGSRVACHLVGQPVANKADGA